MFFFDRKQNMTDIIKIHNSQIHEVNCPTFRNKEQTCCVRLIDTCRWALYDSIKPVVLFAASGLISIYFAPGLGAAFLAASAAFWLTRMVIELSRICTWAPILCFQRVCMKVESKIPRMHYAALLCAAAASPFSMAAGIAIGVISSSYMAFLQQNRARIPFIDSKQTWSKRI